MKIVLPLPNGQSMPVICEDVPQSLIKRRPKNTVLDDKESDCRAMFDYWCDKAAVPESRRPELFAKAWNNRKELS